MSRLGRPARRGVWCCIVAAVIFFARAASAEELIRDVAVASPTFNPTIGQCVPISFSTRKAGTVSVQVVDRDGFVVRTMTRHARTPGLQIYEWDGKDDAGRLVADEAYSFKIDLASSQGTATYFPADRPTELIAVPARAYDRKAAVLSYHLAKAARVHIQAGSSSSVAPNGRAEGPVLKTIVNREPRSGGAVVERWNGLDESGTIYVPDRPNFVVAIAISPLPESSVITVGNRRKRFIDTVAQRTGSSLFTFHTAQATGDHTQHHRGTNVLEDVAPTLRLTPLNAVWSVSEKLWKSDGNRIRLRLSLEGPAAAAFAARGGRLYAFIDQTRVLTIDASPPPSEIEIPLDGGSSFRVLTVNWESAMGTVAVNALRVASHATEDALHASR